jgi:D-alanyl-D-alanine carboxypeptidase
MMGLTLGDQITLEDLLYGLLLPSGNDAAVAIGRYIASSDEAFVDQMNALARRIGLRNTHFSNPHGLDSSWPDHLSTAADLAWLAREAMANEVFARIVSTPSHVIYMNQTPATMYNLNRMLGVYPGADGIKVGFTRRSGPALAASATRDGHRMIVVVLHSNNPPADAAKLLDWAFAVKSAGLPAPTGEGDYPQPVPESWSRGLLP